MASPGILRRVALVRTDFSEELSAPTHAAKKYQEIPLPSSPILVILMGLSSPKRRFLQEPRGVTPQKPPFLKYVLVLSLSDPLLRTALCRDQRTHRSRQ
jgi:hypothetical protein